MNGEDAYDDDDLETVSVSDHEEGGEEELYEEFDREEDTEEGDEGDQILAHILDRLLEYKKNCIEMYTVQTEMMEILDVLEKQFRQDSKQLREWIATGSMDGIQNPVLLECVKGVVAEVGDVASWPTGVSIRLASKVEDFFDTCPFVNTVEHFDRLEEDRQRPQKIEGAE